MNPVYGYWVHSYAMTGTLQDDVDTKAFLGMQFELNNSDYDF